MALALLLDVLELLREALDVLVLELLLAELVEALLRLALLDVVAALLLVVVVPRLTVELPLEVVVVVLVSDEPDWFTRLLTVVEAGVEVLLLRVAVLVLLEPLLLGVAGVAVELLRDAEELVVDALLRDVLVAVLLLLEAVELVLEALLREVLVVELLLLEALVLVVVLVRDTVAS